MAAACLLSVQASAQPKELEAESAPFVPETDCAGEQSCLDAARRLDDEKPEPRALIMVIPRYPLEAIDQGRQGRVAVCFDVSEEGTVIDSVILASSGAEFEKPVLDALNQSMFAPALVRNTPVQSRACRTYRFLLD